MENPFKQAICVLGESGSGKSVTAMSILQLLPRPQATYSEASSIKFKGDEIIDASKNTLLNIRGNIVSMVFQEPMTSLNPYQVWLYFYFLVALYSCHLW